MSQKCKIAVVDDDLRVLESLEDLLESAGHSVKVFVSGQALLDDEGFATIDCLITDIGMPAVDGFELQRLVRARRPDLPVILITGRHEIADQQRALALGHNGFFRKPFDVRALLAAVSRAVASANHGG
ncbi:MAG: response regulator transcription factor [Pseudomonadota bacterium]